MVAPLSNPAAPNPSKLMAQLRMMPDQQLLQYAQMHKNDPYIFPMAFQESNTRKQMRAAQYPQAAQAPKVVDQNLQEMAQPMPEDQGIATLPAPNMERLAGGGIVAFDDGGEVPGYADSVEVPGYAGGVFTGNPLSDYIDKYAQEYKIDPLVLSRIIAAESKGKTTAKNPESTAHGAGQLLDNMWKKMGGGNRADAETQVRNAAKLLRSNTDNFKNATGREPSASEAYVTWVLGDSTGRAVLAADPSASVEDVIKKADPKLGDDIIKKNASIFKDKSVADVTQWAANKTKLPSIAPVSTATAAPTNPAISQIPGQSVKAPPAKDAGITALTGDDNFTDPMTGFSPTQAPVGEKPRVLSKEGARQAMLGVGDLPYAFAGATSDIGNAALRGLTLGRYNEPEPTLGSAHLKRLATDYLGREAESADPAMRNMRTAGEIAGTFINPVAATRTAATQTEAGLNALFGAQKAKEAAAVSTPAKMPLRLTAEQPAIPVTPAGEAAASVVGSGGRSLQETQKALEAERLANQARDQLAANQLAKQAARYAEPNPLLAETAKVASPGEKAARAIQIAGETATVSPQGLAAITPDEPETPKGGMPDLNQAFRQFELGQQYKAEEPQIAKPEGITAAETPKDPVTGGTDWNRLMLQMGLHLMAGKSPNLMTNIGEAGLGTLAMQQAEEKAKSERESKMSEAEYRKAVAGQARAETAAIERGAKEKNMQLEAEKLVQQHMEKWNTGVGKYATMSDKSAPLAEELRVRQEIYRQLGIKPIMAAGAPTGGAKFIGFENPA